MFLAVLPRQVSKDYDFTNKKYLCPQTASPAAGSSGAAPGPAAAGAGAVPSTTGTQPLTVELDVTGEAKRECQLVMAVAAACEAMTLPYHHSATRLSTAIAHMPEAFSTPVQAPPPPTSSPSWRSPSARSCCA